MGKKIIKKNPEGIEKAVNEFTATTGGIGMAMALISNEWKVLALNGKARIYFPGIVVGSPTPICVYTCSRDNRKNGICGDCPVKMTFRDGMNRNKISELLVDENKLNYRLITSPLRNENNDIIAVIELFEDITEKVNIETELLKSEKKYKTLVESLQEGIWVLDKDAKTTFVNPKMAQMLLYSAEEMIGMQVFNFLDDEGINLVKKRLENRKKGIKEQTEVVFIKKNKDKIFFNISGSPVIDDKGNYRGAIAVVSDITERKKMEKKLEDSLANSRALVDIPIISTMLLDINGIIIDVNKTICDKYKKSREELVGLNFFNFTPPEISERRKKIINDVVKEKEYFSYEYEYNGTFFENYINPILNENGDVIRVAVIVHDITGRKIIEKKLKESMENLRGILDVPINVIILIELDGRIIDANKIFCKNVGLARDKILGTICYDYMDKKEADSRKNIINNVINKKEIYRFEEEINQQWFDTNIIPILDENNEVTRIAIFMHDITEKKDKENTLDKIANTLRKTLESKAFINKIFNSMSEALFVVNENRIISLNNYAAAFLLDNEKIIGSKLDDYIDPDDENGRALIKNIFSNKKIINREMVLNNRLGDKIYALFSSSIFKNDQDVNTAVCIFNNITELKKALKIIEENDRRLKQISENINEAFWISNFERNRIFYLSKPYENISGREIKYFFQNSDSWKDIVHPEDREIFFSYMKKMDNSDWNEEYRIVMPDQSIKWIRERIFPLKGNGKENTGQIIGITVDITEYKKAQEEALKGREKLMQSSKLASLGQLASGIAHEIAQPLTGLIFGINNIELDLKDKDIKDDFIIGRCRDLLSYTERIKKLIQHIRVFSREQKLSFYSEFNANDCIENVKSLVGAQYANHGVNFELDLTSDLPMINGNIFRLEQIILDLLSNSKYAVEEKSRKEENIEYKKAIKIKTYAKGNNVFIEIIDNGIGISKENLNKVFDPFFTTKTDEINTGLGLSIAYSLIKEMNGEINIFSEENIYTTVQLYIPAILK